MFALDIYTYFVCPAQKVEDENKAGKIVVNVLNTFYSFRPSNCQLCQQLQKDLSERQVFSAARPLDKKTPRLLQRTSVSFKLENWSNGKKFESSFEFRLLNLTTSTATEKVHEYKTLERNRSI